MSRASTPRPGSLSWSSSPRSRRGAGCPPGRPDQPGWRPAPVNRPRRGPAGTARSRSRCPARRGSCGPGRAQPRHGSAGHESRASGTGHRSQASGEPRHPALAEPRGSSASGRPPSANEALTPRRDIWRAIPGAASGEASTSTPASGRIVATAVIGRCVEHLREQRVCVVGEQDRPGRPGMSARSPRRSVAPSAGRREGAGRCVFASRTSCAGEGRAAKAGSGDRRSAKARPSSRRRAAGEVATRASPKRR